MVDPNRNLSKAQLAFLRECEEEFKHRYTEADPEYRALLTKETENPPIIHPWKQNNHNNNRRNWAPRGGGGGEGRGQGYSGYKRRDDYH